MCLRLSKGPEVAVCKMLDEDLQSSSIHVRGGLAPLSSSQYTCTPSTSQDLQQQKTANDQPVLELSVQVKNEFTDCGQSEDDDNMVSECNSDEDATAREQYDSQYNSL